MRTRDSMRLLLAGTLLSGSIGLAAPAYAQNEDDQQPQTGPVEAVPPVSADADEENIVVTGSRIPQPNLTATSPVTVVNSQEVRLTGTTRAEDLINSLPQSFAAQSANVSNAATGAATINLRNLGEVRTLVLLNGRRLLPGDPNTSAADINAIPAFMVDRVDVLTGGASSVYGADAVAGVVNFIMDTRFEGVRLDTQYSFYQHNNDTRQTIIDALNQQRYGFPTGNVADGGTWDIGGAFGVGFDDGHGHITVYAGYRHIDPVLQGKRDYSACALDGTPSAAQRAAGLTEFGCGGSATSANGTFFTNVGTFQVGAGRNFIPGTTPYNFAPLNYYQRPDERYTAGLFANYEINESIQPYLEFMYMDDRTVAQIAPSGDFANTTFVNCDNPLQSAQQRGILCQPGNLVGFDAAAVDNPATPVDERGTVFTDPRGIQYNRAVLYLARRNIEGGGRQSTLEHESFRIVGGVRGDLSDAWSYDAFYQFGRVNYNQVYLNDFSATRLRRALDVVANPAGGAPVCRSVLTGEDPNCVPWDIYAPGQVSAGALAYLQTPGFQRGFTEETVANASLTGQLGEYGLQFPWAESGIGVALGVEYRKEVLDLQTDIAFQTNDLTGQGAAALPVSGSFDVREAFAEARIPIVEHGFIDELALELGYRYSDYGVGGDSFSTDTYKIAGFFAPIRDVRFRGGYNRAIRAPNIQELFAPAVVALDGTTDPCAGAAVGGLVNGLTAAQCARTGVTAAQFGNVLANPAAQYNGLLGGNANLEPEVADTYTAGVVIQPRFVPRLAITVDWFDIDVRNAIQNLGADNIIASCIAGGDPNFCGRITRDARGTLWLTQNGFIRDLNENIGGIHTRGIDIGASWSTPIGSLGTLGFNFQGTWLDKIEIDQGFGVVFDCTGFFGNQCSPGGVLSGPNSEWRHTLRITWTHPDGYGLTARWRRLGSTDIDDSSDDPDLAGPFTQDGNDHLKSMNYLDLALSFRIENHYSFRLGVNNVLDTEPPVVGQDVCPAGVCSGNTWAGTFDSLGRYIFAGVTLDF